MKRKAHKRWRKQIVAAQKKRANWKAFLKISRKRDIVFIIAVAEAITIVYLSVLLANAGGI